MTDPNANVATLPSVLTPEVQTDLAAVYEVVKESKAGYKTTEFWLTLVLSVLTLLGALPIPDHYKAYIVGAASVAYTLSRGIAKHGVPDVKPAPVAIAPLAGE